jgi:hypothetical protein
LQATFSHVPTAAVRQTFVAAGCRDEAARARLVSEWPLATSANNNNINNNNSNSSSNAIDNDAMSNGGVVNNTPPKSVDVAWVDTGDTVAASYSQHRQTAGNMILSCYIFFIIYATTPYSINFLHRFTLHS